MASGNKIVAMNRRSRTYTGKHTAVHASVEGNTVRVLSPAAEPKREVSEAASRNRARAMQMNVGYVIFLTAMAVATVWVCVRFLKLQSQYTQLQKTSTSLTTTLNSLRLENDTQYERIMSSVNLEDVKQYAIDYLGMAYGEEDQVQYYEGNNGDYVRQYQEIPQE